MPVRFTALRFIPDGRHLASGDRHSQRPTVRIWDLKNQRETVKLDAGDLSAYRRGEDVEWGGVRDLAFSQDGSILACCGRHKYAGPATVLLFNFRTNKANGKARQHVQGNLPSGRTAPVRIPDCRGRCHQVRRAVVLEFNRREAGTRQRTKAHPPTTMSRWRQSNSRDRRVVSICIPMAGKSSWHSRQENPHTPMAAWWASMRCRLKNQRRKTVRKGDANRLNKVSSRTRHQPHITVMCHFAGAV